jgi:hypothetical protein
MGEAAGLPVSAGWMAGVRHKAAVKLEPFESVRFFVRGDFLLSGSGFLSGSFSSRYLMPSCPVCVRP